MNKNGRRLRRIGDESFELDLARIEFNHAVLDLRGGYAADDGVNKPLHLAIDLAKLRLPAFERGDRVRTQAVQVARVLGAENVDEGGVHKMMLEPAKDGFFQRIPLDGGKVRAGAFVARGGAAEIVLRNLDEPAAAFAALHEAGKEVAGAAAIPEAAFVLGLLDLEALLPRLDLIPKRLIDDAQRGHLIDDQGGVRVLPRDALACLRVLEIAQPVPNQPADIQLVVEDACAALAVAVDRGRPPALAGRAADAFAVELLGDGFGRLACGVVAENSADNGGLRLVYRTVAAQRRAIRGKALYNVVAVAIAAARLAGLDASAQAAPRLVREVLEEKRVHRALQADVEVADLAFRERDDRNAGKAQTLVDAGDVFLIAREPVEGFGEDNVELAGEGVLHELLDAGAHQARAGKPCVRIDFGNIPAFARRAFAAKPHLILDGGVALLVGRVAGIDRGFRHGLPPDASLLAA